MTRVGRPRTTGGGRKPSRFKRSAVTYHYKLQVLQYLDSATMAAAMKHFFADVSAEKRKAKKRQIYAWKAQRATIEAKCAAGHGAHQRYRMRGMGATLPTSKEEELVCWINELRSDGVPVTALMLKLKAQEVAEGCGIASGVFTATWSWRKHFMNRHKLSIRKRTREGQTTPADAVSKISEFSAAVRVKMEELDVTTVYNADQTAVNYEYLPTSSVNGKGFKTVWVKCGGKTKERLTAMLLADSDGKKREPFMVFKTTVSNNADLARENAATQHGFGRKLWGELEDQQEGVQIYGNPTAWWNSELSIQFLNYHFRERADMHVPILLLWDDFSGHWREDVLIFARLINVVLMKVPPGYTYVCQPADIAWNKPLKNTLRKEWVAFLMDQVRALSPGSAFKMKPPTRSILIAWAKKAWHGLSINTIKNGFVRAKLAQDLPHDFVQLPDDSGEPDWRSLVEFLREMDIPVPSIDPANDIEECNVCDEDDNEASGDEEHGVDSM